MKKTLLIILALMTAIMLTACGGNGDAVTSGDVTDDINPSELPVTVASEDAGDVWFTESSETTEATEEPEVTSAPEASETEATTTTVAETTTEATTTTESTTTAATTTAATTTTASTTTAATTTTVEEDEEEVEILWEDGIDRAEFEAMLGIGDDDDVEIGG